MKLRDSHPFLLLCIFLLFTVAILIDTVACLKRMHGRTPSVAVTIQQDPTTNAMTSPFGSSSNSKGSDVASWFRSASSFWSPTVVRASPSPDGLSSNDQDEVAVSHWTIAGEVSAQYTVLQNLDHEQRIVWAAGTSVDQKK